MEIKKIVQNSDIARLIAILIQNTFKNQLLLGDLHSPINQLADAYKIESEGEMVGGFVIYKGGEIPVVPLPFGQTEFWPTIREFVDSLSFDRLAIPFPVGLQGAASVSPPPNLGWNSYQWEVTATDYAMRLTKEEIEVMSIDHLPEIRAAKPEDSERIKEFLERNGMARWFHPLQLKSELAVISEDKGEIVGYAGTHFETPYTVQIGNVSVSPAYQGKGLGTAMVTATILGILRTRRIPTLFVNENNEKAIKLYEKIGFEKYDRFSFFLGKRSVSPN